MAKKKEASASPFVPVEEQPYRVPDNWCWTKMGNIAQWGSGGTPSRKIPTYYQGTIPWIKTGELNDDYVFETEEHISDDAIRHSSAKLYPINTIALAMYGATIGKVGILGIEATTNQACACGVASTAAYFKYLFYYALSEKDNFVKKSKGGAQPNISQEIIKEHEIPIPPLPEQHRIVTRIESLFAKLDEAKEKAQAVVDGFELRKSAILHKAFTGELTAKWRRIHPATPNTLLSDIEKFSCNWQKKDQQFLKNAQSSSYAVALDNGHMWIRCTIGAISRVTNGSTPSRKVTEYWDGTIPWVSSGEVRNNIIESTNERITQKGYDNSSVKLLPAGTVLIAMIGEGKTRGQSAILTIDATINQNIAAVVIDHGLVIPRYIWYWFQMNYSRNREKGAGSGPQALNCQRVRELDFYAPSLPEQMEIVYVLDKLIAQEVQAKEAAETVLTQIDTMKKAILARAFRGELGTNDPSEEWAGKLLEPIL